MSDRPHPAVTICHTLWGSGLSFSPFSFGNHGENKLLSFDQLFPEEERLVDTCREAELDREPLPLCSLLLASCSYHTLTLLLRNGVVPVSEPLSRREQATLPHLACALGVAPAISAIRDTLNGASNSHFVWGLKDGKDRTPGEVCFNQELAKKLHHKPFFGSKKNHTHQPHPLTETMRQDIFQLAKEPENFYPLIVALRSCQFKVDSERDETGDLIIHLAIYGGLPSLPLLLALLNHFKADISARDRNGMTPLSLACRLGYTKTAEVLICVGGADMEFRESDLRRTALHSAALAGHPDVVRMLLRRGADPAREDAEGRDAAILAKRVGHHECRQILLQEMRERFASLAAQTINGTLDVTRVTPANICQVTESGETLLILAARYGHAHLLSQFVKIENCPLDYRQMKMPDLLDVSMELSASLKGLPESGEHPFSSALHFATQQGHLECVQILLKAHAHPSLPDCDGWLPLHYACDSEHTEIVRALLTHPAPLALSGLQPAMTLAKTRGNHHIIKLLEEAIYRRQREIVTPALFDAVVSGKADHLFTILENGDDVNPLKEETYDWPLLLAAGFGYLDIVQQLYQLGGHVTRSHSNTGVTPLHVAARGGRENVVSYLLQFTTTRGMPKSGGGEEREGEGEGGRDINCRNRAGATALELAATQGHLNIVRLLLRAGATCSLPDSNGQVLSCPEFAGIQFCFESHRRERALLVCQALERGVGLEEFQSVWQGPWDFSIRTERGDTILMVAAQFSPEPLLRFLLDEASRAPPSILIEGGIPTLSPGRRAICSSEESEHAQSDTYLPRTPLPPRRMYMDSSEPERPISVLPPSMYPKRQQHMGLVRPSKRYPGRGRARSPQRLRPKRSGASATNTSATTTTSSGEDNMERRRDGPSTVGDEKASPPCNSGICITVIRACNPHDKQTALHRAVLADKLPNVSLLLRYDAECVVASDINGDTALHMACRATQRKVQRKIVETLLGCDQVIASVKNKSGLRPEDDCPHSKTRKLVMKKRTKEELDLPDVPDTDPNEVMDVSACSSSLQSTPIDYNKFVEIIEQMKEEKRSKSSTSEPDASS